MKRIFFAVMFVLTLTVTQTCAARDVWVERWNSSNIDVYVMDDTIRDGIDNDGRYFKVSTKHVRNGKLQEVVNWMFIQLSRDGKQDFWRYENSKMDGKHITALFPRSLLFEFCMNRLGWSYRIVNDYDILRYY